MKLTLFNCLMCISLFWMIFSINTGAQVDTLHSNFIYLNSGKILFTREINVQQFPVFKLLANDSAIKAVDVKFVQYNDVLYANMGQINPVFRNSFTRSTVRGRINLFEKTFTRNYIELGTGRQLQSSSSKLILQQGIWKP